MIDDEQYCIILPGRIVQYFSATQTATVKICAELVFSSSTKIGGLTKRVDLEDVPVHTPSGGGWAMTMPISAGDTCLLFFTQVGYDHWFTNDKDGTRLIAGLPDPSFMRKFSEDDGLALVGFNTLPRAIQNYSTNGSQWRNTDTTQNIHLKDDLSIEINSTTEVKITAPTITLTGNVFVVGALDVTGAVTADSSVTAVGPISTSSTFTAAGAISGSAVTGGGIGLATHTHTNPEGGNVGPAVG